MTLYSILITTPKQLINFFAETSDEVAFSNLPAFVSLQ